MKKEIWYYPKSEIVKVLDADTIRVRLNQGIYTWNHRIDIRLMGIDTPESKGKDKCRRGQLAKLIVINILKGCPPATEEEIERLMESKDILHKGIVDTCKSGYSPLYNKIKAVTISPGKYGGRWLGDIIFYDKEEREHSLAEYLLAVGLAKSYQGESKKGLWTKKEKLGQLLWK